MNTAEQPEDWRRKYFDSIRVIEKEERQFRDLDRILRRIVGRLCIVAMGQTSRLDEELRQIDAAVRGDADSRALETLSQRLVAAVNEADQQTTTVVAVTAPVVASQAAAPAPTPATATAEASEIAAAATGAVAGDERVRAVLAIILSLLRCDSELQPAVSALEQRLVQSLQQEELPQVLDEIAALVGRRLKNIERAKHEVEMLLEQMLSRLDDMGSYLAGQDADQTHMLESTATLNTALAGEMRALGESVDSGSDIALVRQQLRTRLDAIDRHLQEYRKRETLRSNTVRERNDHMRQRVEQLESEARKLHSQLLEEQRQSLHDNLTQVPNRFAFEGRVEEEIERFRRFGQPLCFVLWDIDHFKNINDSYGHRAGDKVLKVVARTLADGIRSTDFIARFGGEEFVMLLPGSTIDDVLGVMNTLRNAVAGLGLHFRGVPVTTTISCGITQLRAGDTAADAFDRADKALYAAKDSGRNRCTCS